MPTDKKTATAAPDQPSAAPNYEARLHGFWQKNQGAIFAGCTLLLVAVAAKGAWELYLAQREKSVAADYAAATSPEKLHDFAHEHQGHKLAGAAYLQLADGEYGSGKYADALTDYEHANEALAGTPFAGRAQLGQAICKIQVGRAPDGETQLKQVAGDFTLLKTVRAEAAYDLARLAADEGRVDEARQFIAQLGQIDSEGPWARRASDLQENLPSAAPAGATAGPLSVPGK
jgi:predicted negative regulator of RcsB-dependent stress response